MNFQTLAESYMAERQFKHSTIKNYNSIMGAHILPHFGQVEVADITASDVRLFQIELTKTIGPGRVNLIVQLLKSILVSAYRENVISIDPTKALRKVRQPKSKVEPFSEEEVASILQHADKHFLLLFQTLHLTGMRPNEAIALTWEDVDFDAKTINIDKGCVDGVTDTPKTESSERVIPMVDLLYALLYANRQATGLVFASKSAGKDIGNLDRVWKRAVTKAGVKYRPLYNLRHSAATRMLMRGIPIAYIAKILGHSNASITLRYYARWVDSIAHEANFRSVMG